MNGCSGQIDEYIDITLAYLYLTDHSRFHLEGAGKVQV